MEERARARMWKANVSTTKTQGTHTETKHFIFFVWATDTDDFFDRAMPRVAQANNLDGYIAVPEKLYKQRHLITCRFKTTDGREGQFCEKIRIYHENHGLHILSKIAQRNKWDSYEDVQLKPLRDKWMEEEMAKDEANE